MIYQICMAATSHPGLTGNDNEDALLDIEGPIAGDSIQGSRSHYCNVDKNWLIAVADGMGGANAGEVASLIAVEYLNKCSDSLSFDIGNVLLEIHREILKSGRENPQYTGMGSAVAGIGVTGDGLFVFNVGDCTVYRVVDGFLQRLTVDDSIATVLAMPGTIPNGSRHGGLNRLTQVLGGPDSGRPIVPHVFTVRLKSPARFLLCSDGLTDMVTLDDMEAIIANGTPLDAVQALLDAALAAGGKDNITLMVVDLSPAVTTSNM